MAVDLSKIQELLGAEADTILNHISGVNSGLVSVYQRYEYLPERGQALELYGGWLRTLVQPCVA